MRIDTTKRLSHRDLDSPLKEFINSFPFTFSVDQTVEEVLFILQSRKTEDRAEYLYVTDNENILVGVVTAADILYSSPNKQLVDIMDPDVVKVCENDMLEKGLKLMTIHQILTLPVVNSENRFVGVLEVTPHSSSFLYGEKKSHYKNIREDIFQFIGFSIEQRKLKSPWTEFRYRMPWLLCNLVGGLVCAVIGELYKETLMQFVVLAFFIPLVLTLSESVSIQSMTLSLRFLHLRKIYWRQVWRRMFAESQSSLLLGIASACIITFFYFAWSVAIPPVLAIGSSVIVAMVVSALFGGIFPIILHIMRLDPKVAAGPVSLMMADVLTMTIYLSLSTFVLMR